jgi:hypothetical protein
MTSRILGSLYDGNRVFGSVNASNWKENMYIRNRDAATQAFYTTPGLSELALGIAPMDAIIAARERR